MSDTSQGPGWWQASDGKWYPPEQAPGYQAPASGGGSDDSGGAVALDIGAALSYGWNKFVQYIGQIILIILIIFGVELVFIVVGQIIGGTVGGFIGFFLTMLFAIAGVMIAFILQAGLIRVGLAITKGREPEPGMLFQTENIGPFVIASILVGLLAMVGLIACCIGAYVVLLFTVFYGYYVIDKAQGPTDSISSSFTLVKDNLGSVLLFLIVVVLLNAITCGLAVGVTQIALAYAYRTLNGESVAA